MRRSIARRSSFQMSILSIVGVGLIAVFGYHCVWMWQEVRHQETLERAATAVEQVLARNAELRPLMEKLVGDPRTQPELMRAASKGVFHKNTASRKMSRLTSRVKALAAPKA